MRNKEKLFCMGVGLLLVTIGTLSAGICLALTVESIGLFDIESIHIKEGHPALLFFFGVLPACAIAAIGADVFTLPRETLLPSWTARFLPSQTNSS